MSESSRLGDVVEIGDLSDEHAVSYLKERKVSEDAAKQIVDVTGGRMRLLKLALIFWRKRNRLKVNVNLPHVSFVMLLTIAPEIRSDQLASAKNSIRQAKLSLPETSSKLNERQLFVSWIPTISSIVRRFCDEGWR